MRATRARAAAGSRYSSTNRMESPFLPPHDLPPSSLLRDLRLDDCLNFVGIGLTHQLQALERPLRLLLVDLGHRKTDMDEHPVARYHTFVLQETDIDVATHTGDIDLRQLPVRVE